MHTSESRVKCYKTNKFIVLVNLGVSVTPLWAVEANSVHYKQQEYLRMHFTLPRLSDWSRAKERVKRRRGERRESSEAKLPLRAPLLYREAQGKRKKREKKICTNKLISLPFHCLAPPPPPPASSFLLVSILLYPLGSLLTPPPSLLSSF